MNHIIRDYPLGFVFTDHPLEIINEKYNHYKQMNVHGFYYYYDENTDSLIAQNQHSFLIIHGMFMMFDKDSLTNVDDPANHLLEKYNTNYDEFLDALDFTAGRYVIIIGNQNDVRIYPDATAARSTYVLEDKNAVCSHLNLLNEIYHLNNNPLFNVSPQIIRYTDTCEFLKVKRIIPNFYTDFSTKEKSRFWPRSSNRFKDTEELKKLKLFTDIWKLQLDTFIAKFDETVLSLSGGMDSRVTLAVSKDHHKYLKAFTYTPSASNQYKPKTKWAKSVYQDKKIVDKLLEVVDINHTYIETGKPIRKLTDRETEILDKSSMVKHGRLLIPFYNEYFNKEKTLHIRSNRLEIAKSTYITPGSRNDVQSVEDLSIKRVTKDIEKNSDNYLNLSSEIQKYVKTMQFDKFDHDYHLLDLMYVEGRASAWMSELLNEADLAFETLLLFNNRLIIELSLSFPLSKRKNEYLFYELINLNLPVLNFYAVNRLDNLYNQSKTRSNVYLFDEIFIHDKSHNNIDSIDTNNTLYLPKNYLKENYYAEFTRQFSLQNGALEFSYKNLFFNKNSDNYFRFQVLINDSIVIDNEMSLFTDEIDIEIPNLQKNDKITFRVTCKKNLDKTYWSNATKINIVRYREKELSFNEIPINTYPKNTE